MDRCRFSDHTKLLDDSTRVARDEVVGGAYNDFIVTSNARLRLERTG
jgi:hypothetical protein